MLRLKIGLVVAACALAGCGTAAAAPTASGVSPTSSTTLSPSTTIVGTPLASGSGAAFASVNWSSLTYPEYQYSSTQSTKIVSVDYVDVAGKHLAIVGYEISNLASTIPFGVVVYQANTSGPPSLVEALVANQGESIPSGIPVGISQGSPGLDVAQPFQAGMFGNPSSGWFAIASDSLRVCAFAPTGNKPSIAQDPIGNFVFTFVWQGSAFVLASHAVTHGSASGSTASQC